MNSSLHPTIQNWLKARSWKLFRFQEEMLDAFAAGKCGLLNAPTGSGKTMALWLPILQHYLTRQKSLPASPENKLRTLWITPLKALGKDIHRAISESVHEMEIPWDVKLRSGDTSAAERQKMRDKLPDALVTTPESLHILLAQKGYAKRFKYLETIVIDEWHELLGTKRGVQVELALSRLKAIRPDLKIWGISATIGNLREAMDVLLGTDASRDRTIIRSDIGKDIRLSSILPTDVNELPWAGHLGLKLLDKVIPVIEESKTTLLFTNTRSQTEIWYQALLEKRPDWAGLIAIHHGSMDAEIRQWVEETLHAEKLKVVVCTSSLDLGVDFRPVETVVQIGSPKGVARFIQRAGRSGHRPGEISRMWFVPTHSLELLEGAAMREAMEQEVIESRQPMTLSFDVLIQYLLTLAVSEGFDPSEIYREVRQTHCYQELTPEEYKWCLNFITTGGKTLEAYDEYKKVEVEGGIFKVKDRTVARRHRLSMGTIVSEQHMKVKFLSGKYLGQVEEYFISNLREGDTFIFAGRILELARVTGMTAYVRKSKRLKGVVPRWMGGRIPLSSQLSEMLRRQIYRARAGVKDSEELATVFPLLDLQRKRSRIPSEKEFLIEKMQSDEGYHLFFYPFEGRLVHEGMAALLAWRISQLSPATFSLAMNDYGFELLSAKEPALDEAIKADLFSTENLLEDIQASLNATEMARRKFRDIATISGLLFTGFPGKYVKSKHLQSSAGLLFNVFTEYDPGNLLIRQAYREVLDFQLEEARMRAAMERICGQQIVVTQPARPSPLAFPIMVDRLRESMTNESLEARVKRMQLDFE